MTMATPHVVIADTFYTARLLNQPNDILNLMLGYDHEGFSARVSFLFQDNIFRNPDFWPQLRTMSARYGRWDLSVKQELPWVGLQVYANVNNLNAEHDVTNNTSQVVPGGDRPVWPVRDGRGAPAAVRAARVGPQKAVRVQPVGRVFMNAVSVGDHP